MVRPEIALLWFAGFVLMGALLFWPRRGLYWRLNRLLHLSERVRIEDALKHLCNAELAGQRATADSLAGVLETSRSRAHDLVSRLVAMDLAEAGESGVRLTASGRSYALRILRTHRLLERYFADRTGVAPEEWHELAEAREHALSASEAEELAARMGQPLYDPHGDPIPTAQGVLPPQLGMALTALQPGETGTVTHLEDEPGEVYHRLVALGFNPSVPVKMLAVDAHRLRVLVGGTERVLEPVAANAVTIEPVTEVDRHTVLYERLDALAPGTLARVVQIAPAVQGPQRRRLLDLGVLPGTEIVAEMRSPSGDPIAYRIRGALIALRQQQAHGIYITRLTDSREGAEAPPAAVSGSAA